MPYCYHCKIQVAGNTCPRCGLVLAPQPLYTQTVKPIPPPSTQPLQYKQSAPPPASSFPRFEQTQAQPQYQMAYTQPPAQPPSAHPKKSKKIAIIAVICVVTVLVIASLVYLFILSPVEPKDGNIPTITYEEFLNDIQDNPDVLGDLTFKSYDPGDVIYVIGTVRDARLAEIPSGTPDVDPGVWTVIYFENPSDIQWDEFAYKGDLRSEYTVGEKGKITIHIVRVIVTNGPDMEYPREFLDTADLEGYIEHPSATLEVTMISPGNYTGHVTTDSDIAPLGNLLIQIFDSSAYYGIGEDDGDLTDGDPEEIYSDDGEFYLEFRDINNNDQLDLEDTFTFYDAESGDTFLLYDSVTWETMTRHTFN